MAILSLVCVTMTTYLILFEGVVMTSSTSTQQTGETESPSSGTCNSCCQAGIPGIPGNHGLSGPRGEPGFKGERGDNCGFEGTSGHSKGEKGDMGSPGPEGRPGTPGKVGPAGSSIVTEAEQGEKGEKGEPAQSAELSNGATQQKSAFSVVNSHDETVGTTSPLGNWDNAVTNKGSDFNEVTGVFTCRVPGTYVFMFSLSFWGSKTDHARPIAQLKKDSVVIVGTYSDYGGHDQVTNGAVVDLVAGEEVWIGFGAGGTVRSNGWKYTSFSGYLLYAD